MQRLMETIFAMGISLMFGIGIGLYAMESPKEEELPLFVECETFIVAANAGPEGVAYIGQIELCGQGGLEWSNIWGPVGAERPQQMPSPETDNNIY